MKKTEILATIDSFLNKIDLTPPDSADNKTHLYADYVELLALFYSLTTFTTSEVKDKFKEKGIIKQKESSKEQAEANDENEKWINEIFQIIEDRAFHYGPKYPFQYKNRSITLLQNLTEVQKIYIYLLISSNLNIFQSYYGNLTTDFEEVSHQALLNFIPGSATVKPFGKTTAYKGYAVDKIRKLASEINIQINEDELGEISPKGRMERGLDVVGWIPFDDQVGNKFVFLAQCTCEKQWGRKQLDTKRYESYFNFHHVKPFTGLFIPYAIINFQKGRFHQSDDAYETLIFERKRILDYLNDLSFFDGLNSKIIVDKCLALKTDVV